jgi:multiple sugar transport system permease protein
MSASTISKVHMPVPTRKWGWPGLVERYWTVLSLAPVAGLVLLLMVFPFVNLVYLSFHRVEWAEGAGRLVFVGGANISEFARHPLYWVGLRNTAVFAFFAVSIQLVLGLALALLASQLRRGRLILIGVVLLPVLVPPIVIGAIWRLILNYDVGVLNVVLGAAGFQPVAWLGDPQLAFAAIIVVDVWHWTPFTFLLLLAGLESLPDDVYEAAALDGASAWQSFIYITFPMMLPTLVVTLVFRLILSFKVFDEIFLMTGGGPGTATEVVSYSIYRTFFSEDRVGLGSVMSLFTILTVSLAAIVAMIGHKRAAS